MFCCYLDVCYVDGGMVDMDIFEFVVMIEEMLVCICVIEYCYIEFGSFFSEDDWLVVVCLIDVLDDGLSFVYSFYDLVLEVLSFGIYVILDYIELVCSVGLFFVYLGYWVLGSWKMDYKVKFSVFEIYKGGVW